MKPIILAYSFAALGVLISIVLPLLRAQLPKPPQPGLVNISNHEKLKPYLITAAFSLISAFLVIANLAATIPWNEALIAGYAWDSTLQKMRGAT